jgi:tRNA1(Val) A37 N6-methylase TrmN6
LSGIPNNFNPTAAKALYEKLLPVEGRTLDFSAGYGGRLIGFLSASSGKEYVGIEPLSDSYRGLLRLVELFGKDKIVRLHHAPFEDIDIEVDSFDLVFSSPPYYDLEEYGNEPTQSIIRYSEYREWLDRFWFVVLRKSVEALRDGGHLAVSLGNCARHDLVGDSLRRLSSEPLNRLSDFLMVSRAVYGRTLRTDRVFVYQKVK